MQLREWLDLNGVSVNKLSHIIGANQATLRRISLGLTLPDVVTAKRIEEATYGAVTIEDFIPEGEQ